jgi:uncharacterized protein (UPF0332 family)
MAASGGWSAGGSGEGQVERKAWENLDAARVLLQWEEPCPNASVSRAYYAVYHACWSRMNEAGFETPEVRPGVFYFQHGDLPSEVLEAGVLDSRASDELEDLRELRVTADYFPEDLTAEQAEHALRTADALVRRLLGEEPSW